MDLFTIENEVASFCASSLGAEPQSFCVKNGKELLFQGDEIWRGKSPVIFPLIGAFPKNRYEYNGKFYTYTCHGYASKSLFMCEKIAQNKLCFILNSNAETREIYPFEFTFKIQYTLEGKSLVTDYTVVNNSDVDMYFSTGSHTGYVLNGELEDYHIRFEYEEYKSEYTVIGNDKDIMMNKLMDGKVLPLNSQMFEKGAQTFGNLKSKTLVLENNLNNSLVNLNLGNYPYLTLWSRPKAHFICIEPWSCESAHYTDTELLIHQRGINCLKKGKCKTYSYTVTAI